MEFSQDPTLQLSSSFVSLPLSKLVLGFGNGWTIKVDDMDNEKALYVSTKQISELWSNLARLGQVPRGCMFWTINEEGLHDVHFARDLSTIVLNNNTQNTVIKV